MRKNRETSYDIFVRKLSSKMGDIFLREDIYKMWIQSGGSKSRFSYGLGKGRNQGFLQSLGGGIFLLTFPGSSPYSMDLFYWKIVALLIREHAPSGAIIAHEKSMEISLRDYSIPEKLVLYTRDTSKRLQLGGYEFHFRSLKTGEKSGGKNMYRILVDESRDMEIDNMRLFCLSLEASLLDVASLRLHENGVAEDLLMRFLKKYEKELSRKKLGGLVSYRYIRAINRLRSFAKTHGFIDLYEICLDIIKKEGGGCYLHL